MLVILLKFGNYKVTISISIKHRKCWCSQNATNQPKSMCGSRGETGGPEPPPPPPPKICVRGGVLCGYLIGSPEKGSKGCFYLIFFWLAPLANILKSSKRISPSPVIHISLASMKVTFPCLFCLKLHNFTQFKPKIFWGGPPRHPSPLWNQ